MPILDIEKNSAPQFTHTHSFLASVDQAYEIVLSAEDNEADQLTFRPKLLPDWLKITGRSSNSITLSGVPTIDDLGVNFFATEVSDPVGSTIEHYAVLIKQEPGNTAQISPFSLFNAEIEELNLRLVVVIDASGKQQPYSSIDIVFDTSKLNGTPLADTFSLKSSEPSVEGLSISYTPVNDYLGQIAVKTENLASDTVYEIELSDGINTEQLSLSAIVNNLAFVPDEILTAIDNENDTFSFSKGLQTDKNILIERFKHTEDTIEFEGYDFSKITTTLDSSGYDHFIFDEDNGESSVRIENDTVASSLKLRNLSGKTLKIDSSDYIVDQGGVFNVSAPTSVSTVNVDGITSFKTGLKKASDDTASTPIDLSDVLSQLKHMSGQDKYKLKGAAFAAGDLDDDGDVDLADVLTILKHLSGQTKYAIDTFDLVTDNGFAINTLNADSNGNLTLVINGDADQSHADWDFA